MDGGFHDLSESLAQRLSQGCIIQAVAEPRMVDMKPMQVMQVIGENKTILRSVRLLTRCMDRYRMAVQLHQIHESRTVCGYGVGMMQQQ